jgi:hypothetical protein
MMTGLPSLFLAYRVAGRRAIQKRKLYPNIEVAIREYLDVVDELLEGSTVHEIEVAV